MINIKSYEALKKWQLETPEEERGRLYSYGYTPAEPEYTYLRYYSYESVYYNTGYVQRFIICPVCKHKHHRTSDSDFTCMMCNSTLLLLDCWIISFHKEMNNRRS